MRGWLLDTNVISELRRPMPSALVRTWMEARPLSQLFLSRVTVAEIRYGIDNVADLVRRRAISAWLDVDLRRRYAGRVLEIDEPVMLEWLRMVERGRRMRHTFSQPDLFVAATAAVHDLTVATRNTADYRKAGVTVVNPWSAATP